jgi:beta-barrel assembly-enhancing protease
VPAPGGGRVWSASYLDGRTAVRQAARVIIGLGGLEITLTESGRTFRWPLAEVRQTQGFHEGEQVRLERGGDLAEALLVGDVAFLSALRAAAPQAAGAFHDPARRRFRLARTLLAAVASVGLAAGLYVWGIPLLANVAAARVPVAWEVALGDAAMGQLAPVSKRCRDPERQRRVDEITGVLLRTVPDSRYPFRVTVVDHPMVNAFAAPGGFIVVFRGLLERTENAEELAGVLAHEIQHVLHRDATRAILRQASTGILIAALVGDVSGVMAFGIESARMLGDLSHSREAEHEADRDGLRMLHAAAVNPEGMLAFFRGLEARGEGSEAAIRYLSTHPTPGDRLRDLAALAAAPPKPPVKLLPDYDWSDIKKICGARQPG